MPSVRILGKLNVDGLDASNWIVNVTGFGKGNGTYAIPTKPYKESAFTKVLLSEAKRVVTVPKNQRKPTLSPTSKKSKFKYMGGNVSLDETPILRRTLKEKLTAELPINGFSFA